MRKVSLSLIDHGPGEITIFKYIHVALLDIITRLLTKNQLHLQPQLCIEDVEAAVTRVGVCTGQNEGLQARCTVVEWQQAPQRLSIHSPSHRPSLYDLNISVYTRTEKCNVVCYQVHYPILHQQSINISKAVNRVC